MRVFLTGATGFLGSYVMKLLKERGIETVSRRVDLLDYEEVVGAWKEEGITHVIHCAGVVGGMLDNASRPVDFLRDNSLMGLNVLEAALQLRLERVVIAGSSCMYPHTCERPYVPEDMRKGAPYWGNKGYGMAKRVVAEACEAYREQHNLDAICCVLPNLYGPGANGGMEGHFVASVTRKLLEAKARGDTSVLMLGDGEARRELIYVSDAAEALVFVLDADLRDGVINFGTNADHSVREVVEKLAALSGYEGSIEWGSDRDNGQMRKLMETGKFWGWYPRVSLPEGLKRIIDSIKGGVN